MTTPQPPSELDRELRERLFQVWRDGRDGRDRYDSVDEAERAIKVAILTLIIGDKLSPMDVGALTGPDETPITSSLTQAQAAYLMAHNSLIAKQRQTLTGKPNPQ